MSTLTPAEIALNDQIGAAGNETTAYVEELGALGGGFVLTESAERPEWFQAVMERFREAAAGAGTVRPCPHLRGGSLAVPCSVWAETPHLVVCVACDRQRRMVRSRRCHTCGLVLSTVVDTMRIKVFGPMSVSAAWCSSCPLPAVK